MATPEAAQAAKAQQSEGKASDCLESHYSGRSRSRHVRHLQIHHLPCHARAHLQIQTYCSKTNSTGCTAVWSQEQTCSSRMCHPSRIDWPLLINCLVHAIVPTMQTQDSHDGCHPLLINCLVHAIVPTMQTQDSHDGCHPLLINCLVHAIMPTMWARDSHDGCDLGILDDTQCHMCCNDTGQYH